MYYDITGIILAGGKSTRMGENKALLEINGITVIEHIKNLMTPIFNKLILITNTPDEYKFLGLQIFTDIYEQKGPLTGIHSGLVNSETDDNFIISCDIPLLNKSIIKFICEYKTEHPITVCKADGFIQQLAGKYSKSLITSAEEILKSNENETRDVNQKKRKCSVLTILDKCGAEIINAEELIIYKQHMFFNMNRPEDYNWILKNAEFS
ncbi:MAG: molybdenum cofactor guanylyltransferase [Ignavibacteriae bacterium]|nr:molybdenum cofactor guanylyltransferase [Ignavibacteriota bacterium]MCB9258839.1 molybdenum cofactor guanylyltransferase [Ignavibacteriales bacterium]